MHDQPNIILIGLRASGKSTLGKLLAQHLGRDFVDLDDVTAARMSASGPGQAIDRDGIDAFRANETQALRSVLETNARVIALGGGTPTAPDAGDILASSGAMLIYLRGLPETLRDRLAKSDNLDRPALVGDDVLSEVQTLFDQRDAMYRQLAHSFVHIDGASEQSVLQAIIALSQSE